MSVHCIPILHSVDVLVYGSTSAAVAATISAHKNGATVVVISDRSSFGSESAGTLALLEEGQHTVRLAAFFQKNGIAIPRIGDEAWMPGRFKHELEKLLLQREIPFLFHARPISLLQGCSKRIIGAVLAARTALYAIEAKTFIDASTEGLLGNLLETQRTAAPRLDPSPIPSLTVLSRKQHLEGASIVSGAILEGIKGVPLHLHRYTGERCEAGSIAERADWEGKVRARIIDPSIVLHAEALMSVSNGAGRRDYATTSNLQQIEICVGNSAGLEMMLDQAWGASAVLAGLAKETAHEPIPDVEGEAEEYGFVSSFHRGVERMVKVKLPAFPTLKRVDVVVAGGGTGGAPAGIAAARAGASTVVLEMQRSLGGVGTLGTIASYWFGNRIGFTKELDDALSHLDPSFAGTGKQSMWNPELKAAWYLKNLIEAGGDAWLGSFAFGVKKEGNRVVGVLVSTPWGSGLLESGAVVDATGSADVAAAAGAPCRSVDANHIAIQGAGISPRRPPQNYLNSDFTFVDDDDVQGVTYAFARARARFVGDFDVIPLINTRERRQIIGEVEVSPIDILARRRFPDPVTVARSNFDTHGYTVHPVFMVTPPDHKPLDAQVPYRCLLPRGVDGLLVTGLGMSAHRDALPVIRMQADVQNQGYAAGYAAFLAVKLSCSVREVPFAKLKAHLLECGVLPTEIDELGICFPLSHQEIEIAAHQTPVNSYHAAILLAHSGSARTALLNVLSKTDNALQREEALLLLGLMGETSVAAKLAILVSQHSWDEGWNYRGMGQFGMSCSRVDALLIALAKTGDAVAVDPVLCKIEALIKTDGAHAAFSHCRAVAVAAILLNQASLTEALASLVAIEGVQGHALNDVAKAFSSEPPCSVGDLEKNWSIETLHLNENTPRSHSLREIYLAKALYLCGDANEIGKTILSSYASDLRGPFARHAQAILSESNLDKLRTDTI